MVVGGRAANSDSFKVTTPADREIRMTRLFDAPRQLVFDVMTQPEHVKEWWGRLGDGYSVPVCEIDLRVGGRWRFVNRHPHGEVAFTGEFREIAPPGRLVYTEAMEPDVDTVSLVTILLADEAGKTRLTAIAEYPTRDIRDFVLGTGMDKGAAISYDRLEDLVAALQRA